MNPRQRFEISGQNNCDGGNKNYVVKESDHNYMIHSDMKFTISFSLEVTIAQCPSHSFFFCLKTDSMQKKFLILIIKTKQ